MRREIRRERMKAVNSRQLRYFLAVAEEGQVTRAARKLHIAQPPLSQQIKLLEQDLGVRLLERSGRGIRLTGAGRILARRGREVLSGFEDVEREMADYQKGPHGPLSIGTVASSGATILPPLLCAYHASYPTVDFQIREGNTYRVIELLKEEAVEIGIIRTPFDQAPFEVRRSPEPDEPMVAAGAAKYALLDEPGAMPAAALGDLPLIMHRRYEAIFLQACRDFKPQIICRGDDVRSLLTWAVSGLGVAVVPASAMRPAEDLPLACRELAEPSLCTSVAVIWLKDRYLSVAARRFVSLFMQEEPPFSA